MGLEEGEAKYFVLLFIKKQIRIKIYITLKSYTSQYKH